MCDKSRKDKIRNEYFWEIVGIAPIEDKLRENHLRWFRHIKHWPLSAPVRKNDLVNIDDSPRDRGRPKLTWWDIIRKDMISCGLSEEIALNRAEWKNRIHVANPK